DRGALLRSVRARDKRVRADAHRLARRGRGRHPRNRRATTDSRPSLAWLRPLAQLGHRATVAAREGRHADRNRLSNDGKRPFAVERAELGWRGARLDGVLRTRKPSRPLLGGRPQGESLLAHYYSTRAGSRRFLTAAIAATCLLMGAAAPSAAAQAPVNTPAPEVVGNPLVGERLVCAGGSWSGNVSKFTYRWLREGIQVAAGVIEDTYKVTAADQGTSLWCVVTATNSSGSTEAESSNSVTIPGHKPETPPRNTSPPEVSGKPSVGETLSCSPGTWSGTPPPAFTYQWVR